MNEYSFLYCKAFNTTSMEKLKIKEVDSMNGAFALVTGLLSLFGHQVLGIREASKMQRNYKIIIISRLIII